MGEIIPSKCPVCGAQRSDSDIVSCKKCKFDFAFVEFFADENSRKHWLNVVSQFKAQLTQEDRIVEGDYISVCRDSVSYYSVKRKEVITLYGDGRPKEKKKNVAKYVSNDSNSVILYIDGSVEVYGDNSYGQHDAGKVKDAKFIALSSTCVFIVDSNKKIQVFGSLPQKAKSVVKQWKNVEALVVSDSLVLSFDTSNIIRGVDLTEELASTVNCIERWSGVKKICVHKGVCVALFKDGKLEMTPYNDSYSEIHTWKNISDIVFDGSYVVGLSLNGDIKLAGKSKSAILDAGRKEVGSWKNIVSIGCSNYAFGGYDNKGKLHLTGKFGGRAERLIEEWNEEIYIE